jgi:hypothetical protein
VVSIADQTDAELGGPGSVLVRQVRDHVELERLLARVGTTEGDEQAEMLQQLWRLVFPHAFAEEAVLWPAARRALPDGGELTLRVEQEHQEINALVTELEAMAPDDPGRDELFERIAGLLRADVRDEEDALLVRLQDTLDTAALKRLGRSWEIVRRTAPTRPHPVVARRPPDNVLAALPLTVTDRSRDRLDRLARRTSGPVASVSRVVSRGLAVAAGAIEKLPPMRRGEDPSTSA